ARFYTPAAEDPIPGRSVHRKTYDSLRAPAGRLVRNPGATVSHLPCSSPSPLGWRRGQSELIWRNNRCRPSVPPEPTGGWGMTNRFGIYLCGGSRRRKEFVGRGHRGNSCRPCLAYVTAAARTEGDCTIFLGAVAA